MSFLFSPPQLLCLGSMRNSASTTATMTSGAGAGPSKRDSSPSCARRPVTKPESNQTTNNQKPAVERSVERSNSKRVIQRSSSQRDMDRVSSKTSPKVTIKRVPSIRDPSPGRSKTKDPSVVTVRRGGSKRDASPSLGPVTSRTRLGVRNSTPNSSNTSMKTHVGRSDSLRQNKSNPPSRSSSFNRSESKVGGSVLRAGLATLPRDLTSSRSRSQGDFVTVLEIGGVETRSKSASTRPSRRTTEATPRSNSFKRSGSSVAGGVAGVVESSGTVSVHIKQNTAQTEENRPARKQSIKIGRENPPPHVSRLNQSALKRFVNIIDIYPLILMILLTCERESAKLYICQTIRHY